MTIFKISQHLLLSMTLLLGACGLLDDSASKKPSNTGLIATPVTYYSTSRARYLGAKYKDNVDRVVERIVRNSKTASLQFANNLSSVGGIGFFTHSATKTADERYLEVVLAAPETFETKGAHSDKVNRLFTLYGAELLTILSGDNDIYQDRELTGYGLNLAWRNIIADPAGNRVTLERGIIYLAKEKTRNFLRREINQYDLLADATIFAVEEDGPLNLVSYRPPEVRPESRPAIREDDISSTALAPKPAPSTTTAVPADSAGTEPLPELVKNEPLPVKDPVAKNVPPKPPVTVTQKPKPAAPKVLVATEPPVKPPPANTATVETPLAPAVPAPPVEIASAEAVVPMVVLDPEIKVATPMIKPIAKTTETARAVLEAPKPAPVAPAPKIAPAVAVAKTKSAVPEVLAKTAPAAPAAPLVEPKPMEIARTEPFAPIFVPVPEAAAPTINSKVKTTETARVTADAPKPMPAAPAPKVAPAAPPVEVAKPAVVAPVELKPYLPPAPTVAKRVPVPEPPKLERSAPIAMAESKPVEMVIAPPVAARPVPSQSPVEIDLPVPPQNEAQSTAPVIEASPLPAPIAPTLVVERTPAKPAAEQLALLGNKPIEAAPAKPAIARAAPKPLEGFIIQLAFNDKDRAQRWAEGMEKKGYAVSVTEAGAEGALRVRLGNFVLRDDAERQLRTIKQEGLNGIILNLPQAFRPETRTSIP